MLPSLRVLGTGVARVPLPARELLKSWYLVDLQQTADLSTWWADMEISIPREVQQAIVNRDFSAQQEFQAGYRCARRSASTRTAACRSTSCRRNTASRRKRL